MTTSLAAMEIPRGFAMLPLDESDFLDFIFNYFKAEYAPINSFWSTANATPRQAPRWIVLGRELSPASIRPANAQGQKDIDSLDYFTRKWNLDVTFVRGIVKRFSRHELHDRLEKKLYENARLDLMVRKALREKHLIDALWPSPAPRDIEQELLAQGVQVRRWYGDMFAKYYQVLASVDEFELHPEVDQFIKSKGTLMLIPYSEHLEGPVKPIRPIVASGAGYANVRPKRKSRSPGFGEPQRFEVRVGSPEEMTETYSKTSSRQCLCLKCGTKRDIKIAVSVDSNHRQDDTDTSSRRVEEENTAVAVEVAPPPRTPPPQTRDATPSVVPARSETPEQRKQCPACTFLNHVDLSTCEMCQAELPTTTITKPQSPPPIKHWHSGSVPSFPFQKETPTRPSVQTRTSISSTLFSILPFSLQQQDQQSKTPSTPPPPQPRESTIDKPHDDDNNNRTDTPHQTPSSEQHLLSPHLDEPFPTTASPSLAMMPLSPPARTVPQGLPQSLMDDYLPVSSPAQGHEDEDAGWGDVRRDDVLERKKNGVGNDGESDEDEEDGARALGVLDEVAKEEMGVWGQRED